MRKARIKFSYDNEFIVFWLEGADGALLHIDQWGLHTVITPSGAGSVQYLISLYEEVKAEFNNESRLLVRHQSIADLDAIGLKRLGLPEPAPYRMELKSDGILSAHGSSFSISLLNTEGQKIPKYIRRGALIKRGSETFTLLDPIYSLLEGVERFNQIAPNDIDGRFEQWADLKELLPADAIVDDQLKTMTIVRSDTFSLDYSADHQINPVLLSRKKTDPDRLEEPEPSEPLPPEKQREFESKFHAYQGANPRYTVSGSWYVILGKSAQKALSVVREYQDKSIQERRGLLDNPLGIFKEYLGGELSEEEIESVFEETHEYISSRVAGLGEWHPKICAYVVKGAENQWLPPEDQELNIPLQGGVVQVEVKQVADLIDSLEVAHELGQVEVNFNGQTITASDENIEKLRSLGKAKKTGKSERAEVPLEQEQEQSPENLVPIIIDNLEELGYTPPVKEVSGAFRGIPALINKELYTHQHEGLAWLQNHWIAGHQGALLADDMGLGKTIQTLAFLAWIQEQHQEDVVKRKPFLIVAPTGLLRNWEDEAKDHLDGDGLGILHKMFGPGIKKALRLSHRDQIKSLTEADWVLTTYETMRDKINMFIGVEWGVVVFDEVQKIKNPTSRVTEMAKSIDSDFMLALTGTPVENRLQDLWSILDTASPGYLGSLSDFHKRYEGDSEECQDAIVGLSSKVLEGGSPPIMLRRMKEGNLSDIPKKREHAYESLMSDIQAEAYREIIESASGLGEDKMKMLKALQSMRSISLLGAPVGVEGLTDQDIKHSARLLLTMNILDEVASKGEKALIFIESRAVQELLIPYLQQRYSLPTPPRKINGAVSGAKRKMLVDEFQCGAGDGQFDVMILSPKAAGVGLTITAANHVVHLTRWWNPAVEDQCTDRAYRIGQKRDVHVHLPLAIYPDNPEHSFDLNLHHLLENKRSLSRTVLAPVVASDQDLSGLYEGTFFKESH